MSSHIHEIIDEGMMPSVQDQLIKYFGDTGGTPIYFRSTNQDVVMLASAEPITDKLYAIWSKTKEMEEEE